MIGIDVKRREDQRCDIFCCVQRYKKFRMGFASNYLTATCKRGSNRVL